MNYAEEARTYAVRAEAKQRDIVAYVERLGERYPGQLAAVQAEKDRAFNDLVGDRNRFVQWSIMYSNLAALAGQQLTPERVPQPRTR
jgi:hypothetical protein